MKRFIENIEVDVLNKKIENISKIPPTNIIDDNGGEILFFLKNELNKN